MKQTLATMKALADRNRLRIAMALACAEELCACQVTELLTVSGATVSNHLNILHRAGIVQSRREGKWIFYRLSDEGAYDELLAWLRMKLESSAEMQQDYKMLQTILSCDREDICRKQRGEQCCPTRTAPEK